MIPPATDGGAYTRSLKLDGRGEVARGCADASTTTSIPYSPRAHDAGRNIGRATLARSAPDLRTRSVANAIARDEAAQMIKAIVRAVVLGARDGELRAAAYQAHSRITACRSGARQKRSVLQT